MIPVFGKFTKIGIKMFIKILIYNTLFYGITIVNINKNKYKYEKDYFIIFIDWNVHLL